jgi:prepilin-type N-terminal cleavage/methylation domain-containing protein
MKPPPFAVLRRRAFTLIEIMLVMALVSALSLLTWKAYGRYVAKAESVACTKKMVNFGAALTNYVTEKQTWPQEDVLNGPNNEPPDADVLWDWWYKQMKEYGIGHDDWFCPTDLKLREREKKADEAEGADGDAFKGELKDPSYIPAKFDHGFYKPFESPSQPWLVERVGHPDGMNKLLPDGRVQKEFQFKALKGGTGGGGGKK